MNNLSFTLTEKETQACEEFRKKHKEKCCPDRFFSALGMQFSYIITPGGLGNAVKIRCNACGEEDNVTDYNW